MRLRRVACPPLRGRNSPAQGEALGDRVAVIPPALRGRNSMWLAKPLGWGSSGCALSGRDGVRGLSRRHVAPGWRMECAFSAPWIRPKGRGRPREPLWATRLPRCRVNDCPRGTGIHRPGSRPGQRDCVKNRRTVAPSARKMACAIQGQRRTDPRFEVRTKGPEETPFCAGFSVVEDACNSLEPSEVSKRQNARPGFLRKSI